MLLKTDDQRKNLVEQVALAAKLGTSVDELRDNFSVLFDDPVEALKIANTITQATGIYIDAQKIYASGLKGNFVKPLAELFDEINKKKDLITDPVKYQILFRGLKQLGVSEEAFNQLLESRKRMLMETAKEQEKFIGDAQKSTDRFFQTVLGLDDKFNPFKTFWLETKQLFISLYKIVYPILYGLVGLLTAVMKIVNPILRAIESLISFGLDNILDTEQPQLQPIINRPNIPANIDTGNLSQLIQLMNEQNRLNNSPQTSPQSINLNNNQQIDVYLDSRKFSQALAKKALIIPNYT
jgi:hypothetical protein